MALWPQLMSTSLLAMSACDALWALKPMLMSTSLLSMSAFHDAFGLHEPLQMSTLLLRCLLETTQDETAPIA